MTPMRFLPRADQQLAARRQILAQLKSRAFANKCAERHSQRKTPWPLFVNCEVLPLDVQGSTAVASIRALAKANQLCRFFVVFVSFFK